MTMPRTQAVRDAIDLIEAFMLAHIGLLDENEGAVDWSALALTAGALSWARGLGHPIEAVFLDRLVASIDAAQVPGNDLDEMAARGRALVRLRHRAEKEATE